MNSDSKSSEKQIDHKAWAKRLKARHEAGEKLLQVQINFYREALGLADPNSVVEKDAA